MNPRAKSIALLVGALSVLGFSYLLDATTGRHPVESVFVPEAEPLVSATVALAPLEVEESPPTETRQFVTEHPAVLPACFDLPRLQASRSTLWSPASGRLRVRAIDSKTGETLQQIRVRAMSATRLADRQTEPGSGEIELTLTPDTYSVLVQSRGYEPRELDPVRIVAGETVSLEPSALRPGHARILGLVTGLDPDRGLEVELRGKGRRPCPTCATEPNEGESIPPGPMDAWNRASPCSECGYSAASTRVRLPNSGGFTFGGLASGIYAVCLTEGGGQALGIPTVVELSAEESLSLAIEALSTRTVRLELIDADGRSLGPEWSRRVRRRAPIENGAERFLEDDFILPIVEGPRPLEFACRFSTDEVYLASADFFPPVEGPRGWSIGMSCGRIEFVPDTPNDDRPLGDSETLRPEPSRPEIDLMRVDAAVDAEGLVRFERVPGMALTLEMSCGRFAAKVSIPASGDLVRVSACLIRGSSSAESEGSGPKENAKTFLEYEAIHDREGGR